MKEYTDEIRRDEMQNLTCILNPENDVRIMLSAHADEIGLMISNIREDGRLQVIDRGGIVPATYPGRQVRIKTKNGEVYGVVEAYRDLFKEENPVSYTHRADGIRYSSDETVQYQCCSLLALSGK